MGQIMPEWLRQRAHLTPGRLALVTTSERLTFAELNEAVDRRAGSLRRLGVQPGHRVALLLRNGRPFVELVHAVTRVGATLVPLNTRLTPDELAYQIANCQPSVLLHDGPNAAKVRAIAATRVLDVDELPKGVPHDLVRYVDLDQPHTVVYTSGTTGRPKGALLTFGNHWWSAVGSVLNLGLRDDDRWLAILPLFHVGGLAILLRSVIYGITAVVQDGFDAAAANRAIDEHGVTIVSVVATALQRMLEERGGRPYPAYFRCALLGGGPAPRPLLELAAARRVPVVQTYGLTEAASQVATLAPEDALRKLGSAGRPLFPNELRIAAPDRDGVGEIQVRGPTVTPGYLDAPARLEDGWLRTGDLGRLDAEGYLYVVDRRDDLIVSGGENVYPAEVEAALLAHPAVREAAVFGASDATWGQRVVAAIVASAPVEDDALLAFLRTHLAGYKLPRRIIRLGALPRNAAGKVLRAELRTRFADPG